MTWPDYKDRDPKGWCGDPTRGAAMGRDALHGDASFAGKLKIEHVPLDGDYDTLGTYWGGGEGTKPLWWVCSEDGEIQFHERARRRARVVTECAKRYPLATIEPEDVLGIEDFFRAYIVTALAYQQEDFSDDSDEKSLSENDRGPSDIHAASLAGMREECAQFLRENAADIDGSYVDAGKDFWHTRNEDGVGFWDGGWPDAEGKRLTDAAHAFGHCDLYVGDDGVIYVSGFEPPHEEPVPESERNAPLTTAREDGELTFTRK